MSYFEIGIFHPRNSANVGTLWRSAYQLGASGIFIIGRPYRRQTSDTANAQALIPLRQFDSFEDFLAARPVGAQVVGIEMVGAPLARFVHPERALYLLGAEDSGLSPHVLSACNAVVAIESVRSVSYNLAVSGSIVMYHRLIGSLRQTGNSPVEG
jgi:tRNA G18 (ribose-2'-O)-methylase SpoU